MDEAVSHFITGTCQLFPEVCLTKLHNLILEIALKESSSPLSMFYVVGSAAETSIRSVYQDIRDINVMLYSGEEIAVENVTTGLTSKLTGYCDTITCYEMEPYHSHSPGYVHVRLRLAGAFSYNWESARYAFIKQDFSHVLSIAGTRTPSKESERKLKLSSGQIPQGPVRYLSSVLSDSWPEGFDETSRFEIKRENIGDEDITSEKIPHYNSLRMFAQHRIPIDSVYSIRCPEWPKEAASWIFRLRPSGWPSRELVSEVVRNGCDVVLAKHVSCEEKSLLWRISFSKAELVLLRHWTHTQHIVYHMLRHLVKRELAFRDIRLGNHILKSYHLKTLMLWSCESELPLWWKSSSLIVICCRLLLVLCKWTRQGHYPHFFIPNCNLFDCELNDSNRQQLLKALENFQEVNQMSQWFLQNYVLALHPKLGKLAHCSTDLRVMEHTMLLACRLVTKQMREELEYWIVIVSNAFRLSLSSFGHIGLQRNFSSSRSESESRDCFSEFTQYITALNLLHLVGFVNCREDSHNEYKISEVVADIFSTKSLQSVHGYPLSYADFLSPDRVYNAKAMELMSNLTGLKSSAEFHLLAKLSIECLKASLILQGSDMDEFYFPYLVYLAVLHDAIEEKDVSARLVFWLDSIILTVNTAPARLNGFLMLCNDDVSNILGFLHLESRVAKHRIIFDSQTTTLSSLSVELFVKYLRIRSGADNTQRLMSEAMQKQCTWSLADIGLFSVMDYRYGQHYIKANDAKDNQKTLIYTRLTARHFNLSECYVLTEIELEELLTESALDRLQCFFESVSESFGVRCNTALCYRALHLYSRCQYEEVLKICEKLIQDEFSPLLEMQSPCFAVTTTPPFDKFYDRDIQSLIGFGYMVDMCSCSQRKSSNSGLVNLPVFGYSRYNRKLIVHEMNKKTFVTGRFIANYLKLRCILDMNGSLTEIAGAYQELKARLPFENIIRYFVLKMLCRHLITSVASHHKGQNTSADTMRRATTDSDVGDKLLIDGFYKEIA